MALTSNARILYERCPLCEHASFDVIAKGDYTTHPHYRSEIPPIVTWMRCDKCGHVFTEGYFTEETIRLVFSNTSEKQVLGNDMENQRLISARMIEKVLPYQSSGTWMDIGVGNGSLLFTAEEYGFNVVGFDLRRDTIDALCKMNYKAYCSDFQLYNEPGAFAVISMADVLEHMPFPSQALRHVHTLLADGGIAFISLPNSENMLWRLLDLQRKNPYWSEIEHYHNFSRARLFELLKETGFEPIRYGVSERYHVCMEVLAAKK